jgi:hypothetical protein
MKNDDNVTNTISPSTQKNLRISLECCQCDNVANANFQLAIKNEGMPAALKYGEGTRGRYEEMPAALKHGGKETRRHGESDTKMNPFASGRVGAFDI